MKKSSVLRVETTKRNEAIDLTRPIRAFLREQEAEDGVLIVYVPHTTAAVTINENADPDVRHDILTHLSKLVPLDSGFRHAEGNSDAHIKTSLVCPSVSVLVSNGEPVLGTWQSIFFYEFDGPRDRKVYLKFLSD